MKHCKHTLWAALCACLLLAALTPSALGQAAEPTPVDNLFTDVQFLGGAGQENVYDALPLPEGSLLLACTTQGGFDDVKQVSKQDIYSWLLCLAEDGSVSWQQIWGDIPGSNVIGRPALQPDGTISLRGGHSVQQNPGEDYVYIFSPQGEQLSRTQLEKEYVQRKAVGPNYWYYTSEPRQYQMATPAGDILFTHPIEDVGGMLQDAFLYEDGFVSVGREISADTHSAALVTRLRADGTILWKQRVEGAMEITHFWKGLPTSDGNLLLIGSTYNMPTEQAPGENLGMTALLAPDGSILWQQEYPLDSDAYTLSDGAEVPGGYALCYTTQTNSRVAVLVVDAQGQEQRRLSFRQGKEVYYTPHLVQWNGGHWLYTSVERKGQGEDILLMRLNVDALGLAP